MLQYSEVLCVNPPDGVQRFFRVRVGGINDTMFRCLYAGYQLCCYNKLSLASTVDRLQNSAQRIRDELVQWIALHPNPFQQLVAQAGYDRFVTYILRMCEESEGDQIVLEGFVDWSSTLGNGPYTVSVYRPTTAETITFDASRSRAPGQSMCTVYLLCIPNGAGNRWEWLVPVASVEKKRKSLLAESQDNKSTNDKRKKARTLYDKLVSANLNASGFTILD